MSRSFLDWRDSRGKGQEQKETTINVKEIQDQLLSILDAMRCHYHHRAPVREPGEEEPELSDYLEQTRHLSKRIEELVKKLAQATPDSSDKKSDLSDESKLIHLLTIYEKLTSCLKRVMASEQGIELFFHNPLASPKEDVKLEQDFFCDLTMLLRLRFQQKDLKYAIEEIEAHLSSMKGEPVQGVVSAVRAFLTPLSRRITSSQDRLQMRATVSPANFMEETEFFWELATRTGAEVEEGVNRIEFLLQDIMAKNAEEIPALQKLLESLSKLRIGYQRDFFSLGQNLYQHYQRREWIDAETLKSRQREEFKRHKTARKNRIIANKAEKPLIHTAARAKDTPIKDARIKGIVLSATEKPTALSKPPELPPENTIEGHFQAFEKLCRHLAPLFQSFIQRSEDSELVLRTRLQHESATNLLESLPVMRELCAGFKTHGELPFFAHLLHLKLAVLLEQASLLATSTLNIYRAPDEPGHALFLNNGRECFWEKHSPYQLAKILAAHFFRTQKRALLTKDQLSLLQRFERTIAVTSRMPHSGGDELTDLLEFLADHDDPKQHAKSLQEMERKIMASFTTGITLLKSVEPPPAESKEIFLSLDAIKACLAPLPSSEAIAQDAWKHEMKDALTQLDERLDRLQQRLAIPAQRRVPAIDPLDRSRLQRAGTIWGCLNDLQANLKLCRRLLTVEDPSLCLVTAESCQLQQAAILEKVLLIVLSHLPCRSSPHSSQHFLWREDGKRPLRYRHAIEKYAEVLPTFLKAAKIEREEDFFKETWTCAQALGGHLRNSYRYYNQSPNATAALRDKIKDLSILRDLVARERLASGEAQLLDDCLGITNPLSRLSRLDSHIAQVLQQEVKWPTLRMLELADEWLDVYEELLHA